MAWLEQDRPNGPYQLVFRWGNERIKRSTRTKDQAEAQEIAFRVDRQLKLVEEGILTIPPDADPIAFLMGRPQQNPITPATRPRTFADACASSLNSIPQGAIEENTRATLQYHLNPLQTVLGKTVSLRKITSQHLQEYIASRALQKNSQGDFLSPETIRKEVATFTSVWKMAHSQGWVEPLSVTKGLKYPKDQEKPPFQTHEEIQSRIQRGGFSTKEIAQLWDSLVPKVSTQIFDMRSGVEK